MSGFYVIVVGYDQQAKCQLLNAMARQPQKFSLFSCRRSPIVKAVKNMTIGGHTMNLVQTPSLSTPAWVKVENSFKENSPWQTRHRIFVYAKTQPSNVDDVSAISALKNKFGKNVRGVVCFCQKIDESDRNKVNDEHFKYTFQLDCDFQSKTHQSKIILDHVMEPAQKSTEPSQIGSDKHCVKPVVQTSFRKDNQPPEKSNVSSVEIPESANTPPTKQKLTQEEWVLFQRALRFGLARSNHVRVNVVGNHGVGKTTLIKRLLMQKVQCPDPNQTPTENLDVHHLIARCVEKSGEKVWENDDYGTFLEDLNIQRMAQAMIETAKMEFAPDSAVQEIELGSDFITDDTSLQTLPEATDQKILPPSTLSELLEKENYLKKIVRCKELLLNEKHERQYVSYWDFAGQATYYATHQLFMSPLAVYLLVIDLRKELEDIVTDNLEFRSGILQSCTVKDAMKYWIHSVQAYTKDENGGNAPIIIVGTHRDDIDDTDQIEKKFNGIRQLFGTNFECIALDNFADLQKPELLNTLRDKIIDNGLGVMDKKVSSQWINLDYDMKRSTVCQKEKCLKFSQLQQLDKNLDLPMRDVGRLEAFLCHQHYKGKLLFYQHQDLKDLIITDPMLMVKFLNLLLRRSDTPAAISTQAWNEDGILNQSYIETVAKELGIEEYAWMILLKILVKLNILHPLAAGNVDATTDKYFLPCLLKDVPEQDSNQHDQCKQSSLFQVRFSNDSLYQTTYHQIICALLKTVPFIEEDGKKLVYNLQANFDVEGNQFVWLTLYWQNSRIYLYVKDFNHGSEKQMNHYVDEVIKVLTDAIEDVLSTNQHRNIEYSFWVECPSHPGSFLSLEKLEEEQKVMCGKEKGGIQKRHKVEILDIPSITVSQSDAKDEDPNMKQKPSNKVLARLAWKLKIIGKENSTSLALRLKLCGAFTKADVATRDYNDPGTDLLFILMAWNQDKTRTNWKLLRLLCKRDDYDDRTLKEAMFNPTAKHARLDNIPEHVATENKDIAIISDHLGNGFTFVLIELGVGVVEIGQTRRNHIDDTRGMIRELLHRWRNRNPSETTKTKAILEAMRMFEVPLDPVIRKLNELANR